MKKFVVYICNSRWSVIQIQNSLLHFNSSIVFLICFVTENIRLIEMVYEWDNFELFSASVLNGASVAGKDSAFHTS